MTDGLIDRLHRPDDVLCGDWYNEAVDDVRELLRDDETRTVIADALATHRRVDMSFRPLRCSCGEWNVHDESWDRHLTDAVVRVLTGEEADR